MRPAPEDILRFWFEETPPSRRFAADRAFDARVRRLYAPFVFELARVRDISTHRWLDAPDSALALVIALDQFPRNIWRGAPRAFALDDKGREAARIGIDAGFDFVVEPDRRAFFYMPFMHSESLVDQDYCLALCEERIGRDSETARHARAHRDLIARFGRFPYRNAALGRASSEAEKRYLEEGGYRPGAKGPAK